MNQEEWQQWYKKFKLNVESSLGSIKADKVNKK